MTKLTKIISTALRKIADDVEAGVYICSDEELSTILDDLAQFSTDRPMSKELACLYLNMSRSVFDTNIRNGLIPKGKKVMGFKELSWDKGLLDKAVEDMQKYGYN